MTQDERKRRVAEAALEEIEPALSNASVIGVGTGSTANLFIDALARIRHKFDAAVASSQASAARLEGHGIRVLDLNAAAELEVYIDGADEVDPRRCLIKGGGGALTREKIVASAARRFVCIVDDSKLVARLGTFPLPVEVIPMARSVVARALVRLGGAPEWRQGTVTDNGNWILDVYQLDIGEPRSLEQAINDIPGVVDNGIFARNAPDLVLAASATGVTRLP